MYRRAREVCYVEKRHGPSCGLREVAGVDWFASETKSKGNVAEQDCVRTQIVLGIEGGMTGVGLG